MGPHLAPLVTQHSSVLQMEHLIQSHPSFFCSITWHCGQCMASPSATSFFYMKNRKETERWSNLELDNLKNNDYIEHYKRIYEKEKEIEH